MQFAFKTAFGNGRAERRLALAVRQRSIVLGQALERGDLVPSVSKVKFRPSKLAYLRSSRVTTLKLWAL